MASEEEKLCMAIIRNSEITKIKWEAVAKDLGVGTVKAATCRWYRVKKKFEEAQLKNGPEKGVDVKSSKANTGKKRALEDISAGEEEKIIRKQPARKKGRGRKPKKEDTPETEDEEVMHNEEDEI